MNREQEEESLFLAFDEFDELLKVFVIADTEKNALRYIDKYHWSRKKIDGVSRYPDPLKIIRLSKTPDSMPIGCEFVTKTGVRRKEEV